VASTATVIGTHLEIASSLSL